MATGLRLMIPVASGRPGGAGRGGKGGVAVVAVVALGPGSTIGEAVIKAVAAFDVSSQEPRDVRLQDGAILRPIPHRQCRSSQTPPINDRLVGQIVTRC